jgi:flagellar L-ring protein precursor FlgH
LIAEKGKGAKLMTSSFLRLIILSAFSYALSGCSTYVSQLEGQSFEPVDPPIAFANNQSPNGAIFRKGQSGLFATDQRARRIGDILTVSFNETFSATKAQTSSSSKNDAFGVTLPTALPNILTGGFATDDSGTNGGGLKAGTARTFAGAGNAAQSNSFTGLLSVTVIRVFENGNMEVAGQKEITLNQGNEYVRVRGVVRPEDISATNLVSSNRLADAQIRYTGSGHLADTAKPGWLSNLMREVSPF